MEKLSSSVPWLKNMWQRLASSMVQVNPWRQLASSHYPNISLSIAPQKIKSLKHEFISWLICDVKPLFDKANELRRLDVQSVIFCIFHRHMPKLCVWEYFAILITSTMLICDSSWQKLIYYQLVVDLRSAMLTHWGRDKMAAIFQTTFSNAFSWMKMHEFRLRFHWSLFPRVQLTKFQHWFR